MKKDVPNYWDLNGCKINSIYNKLSKEDRKVIDDYIRERSTTASDYKVRQYKTRLLILRDIAEVNLSKFNNAELINNLLILIKNSDREACGKNELRKVLKNFLEWKFKDTDLIKNIRMEKSFNEKRFNASALPSPEEIEKLIRVASYSLKLTAMITLQSELALRPHELLNLKWKSFKFFEGYGEVEIYANKTTQVRVLPFKDCLIHILRWKEGFEFPNRREEDYIFPNPDDRTKPLYKQYMAQIYRRLSKRAGIRKINPYMIRHAVLSSIYKKTKDSRLTAKFGGHSLKTSEVYVNLNDRDIKDIILEQIYNIKEPSIEVRNRLEKEMKEMNISFNNKLDEIERTFEQYNQREIKHQEIFNSLIQEIRRLKGTPSKTIRCIE